MIAKANSGGDTNEAIGKAIRIAITQVEEMHGSV